jgi:hypothetical protein
VTTPEIIQFFEQRPFEPFTISTIAGREFQVLHPEVAFLGRAALVVWFVHPTRQLEVIDTGLIVSLRTIYATEFGPWTIPI